MSKKLSYLQRQEAVASGENNKKVLKNKEERNLLQLKADLLANSTDLLSLEESLESLLNAEVIDSVEIINTRYAIEARERDIASLKELKEELF